MVLILIFLKQPALSSYMCSCKGPLEWAHIFELLDVLGSARCEHFNWR